LSLSVGLKPAASGHSGESVSPVPHRPGHGLKPIPFLRWAGSKRQVLHHLAAFWNTSYSRYVEPFAGSSCLFFEIQPAAALLADKNAQLIQTYEVLRDDPDRLHRRLTKLSPDVITYYRIRAQDAAILRPFERALRFLYLNRYCFNGIYRTNSQGLFNVPMAKKLVALPPLEQFHACANLLKNSDLRAWDFGRTLRYVQKGDFVYLDPPYAVASRRIFREYGPKSFAKRDLTRLAKHLRTIDQKGATFVLSYADCAEARSLGAQWLSRRILVRRNIAGFAGARRSAYEVVVTNAQMGDIHGTKP
jgi:DNA adenine methylase